MLSILSRGTFTEKFLPHAKNFIQKTEKKCLEKNSYLLGGIRIPLDDIQYYQDSMVTKKFKTVLDISIENNVKIDSFLKVISKENDVIDESISLKYFYEKDFNLIYQYSIKKNDILEYSVEMRFDKNITTESDCYMKRKMINHHEKYTIPLSKLYSQYSENLSHP